MVHTRFHIIQTNVLGRLVFCIKKLKLVLTVIFSLLIIIIIIVIIIIIILLSLMQSSNLVIKIKTLG